MRPGISRRRVLALTAVAACLPRSALAATELHTWSGTALGAQAGLRLYHPDAAEAERMIAACVGEMRRLERVFSIYRPDSALSRFNAAGELAAPPLDLVRILGEAGEMSRVTGGVFDVTIQPLWRLYADHFSMPEADPEGPPPDQVARVTERIGHRHVRADPERLAFARPGMAVSLNGIGQGYITDRVAEILRDAGFDHVLVDLGEARAIGTHPDGTPWRAALAEGEAYSRVDLRDRALATSAPGGFVFDAARRFHHIFDPRTGHPAARYRSVSVLAPDATRADALATAFVQMPEAEIAGILASHRDLGVHLLREDGSHAVLGSPAG